MTSPLNRRIVLASRPEGFPTPEHFRLETAPVPEPEEGRVLVRNLYLSLDPYMRGRMSDRASYAKPVELGEVMVGGTVGEVIASRSENFSVGQVVVGYGGWQDYAVMTGRRTGRNSTIIVPTGDGAPPITTALGVAGMPGCTAYFGLHKLGKPQPGETLVVSAASGAVGSAVGQLGKMAGCRVVGVAGGERKCSYCTSELGFDACIDYKAEGDLGERLRAACPDGVAIYFEYVGGEVARAVAPLLRRGARVPVCGIISQYNSATMSWPGDELTDPSRQIESRFFLVWEWPDEYQEVAHQLATWAAEGKLRYREDIIDGLEQAPSAFGRLFRGENFGKLLVKIADPSGG